MANQTIQLFDYNGWANNKVIEHLKTLPAETLFKEIDLGFKSIAEVIGHLISVDKVWFARILEAGPSPIEVKPFADIEEASIRMYDLHSQIRNYLLSIDDFDKKLTYTNKMGQQLRNSVTEIIGQVVNHGTYHRGNITTMLRFLGYKGVQTDYIAYLWR